MENRSGLARVESTDLLNDSTSASVGRRSPNLATRQSDNEQQMLDILNGVTYDNFCVDTLDDYDDAKEFNAATVAMTKNV